MGGNFLQGGHGSVSVQGETELLRVDAAAQQVEVGNRERPFLSVAGRPRAGPGTLRPYLQAVVMQPAYRAATGRHRFDSQRLTKQAGAPYPQFGGVVVAAAVARHIGAGTAHIDGEHLLIATGAGSRGRPHHTTGRPAKQAVFGVEMR